MALPYNAKNCSYSNKPPPPCCLQAATAAACRQLNYNLTTTNNTPDKATIQMYNILGKPVFTATISGTGTYTLPLDNFEKGLYYYTIVLTNNRQVLKGDKLLITN